MGVSSLLQFLTISHVPLLPLCSAPQWRLDKQILSFCFLSSQRNSEAHPCQEGNSIPSCVCWVSLLNDTLSPSTGLKGLLKSPLLSPILPDKLPSGPPPLPVANQGTNSWKPSSASAAKWVNSLAIFFFVVLGIEPKISYMLRQLIYPRPFPWHFKR